MWTTLGLVVVALGSVLLSVLAITALAAQTGALVPLDPTVSWWPAGLGLGALLGAAATVGATRHQVRDSAGRIKDLEASMKNAVTKEDLAAALAPIADAMDRAAGAEERISKEVTRAIERLNDGEIEKLRLHGHDVREKLVRLTAILEYKGMLRHDALES